MKPRKIATNTASLRRDLHALDEKIARLAAAVEEGASLAPIVAKLRVRQTERDDLLKALAAADAVAEWQLDQQDIERRVLGQIDQWRKMLATHGRQVLREAMIGPIRFRPVGREYHFDGRTAAGS